ncbi:MAG: NosD domain-containing protein, partial [Promethearchaeota archaeon]
ILLVILIIFSSHLKPPEQYTTIVPATACLASFDQNGDYIPSPIVIDIDGDNKFHMVALARGWEGDGSVATPYIIEGYSFINATSTLVNIRNTTINFIFQHNWLDGINQAYIGIYLQNVNNSIIRNNVILDNMEEGIFLEVAFHNTIDSNLIFQNGESGIMLNKSGSNSIVRNSIIENVNWGIWIPTGESQDNFIYRNDFVSNSWGAAEDNGIGTIFEYNYYYPGSFIDLDDNGIADLPYIIPGAALNQDSTPREYPVNDRTKAYLPPYLTQIRLINPDGGETFIDSVGILWIPVEHSRELNVTYTLWYSTNRGTSWHVIIENITENWAYSWDVSSISTGYWNALRIVATTSDGLSTFDETPLVFGIINEDIPYTLSTPQILPLKTGQTLFDAPYFHLEWREAIDSCEFPVTYVIYSSTDNGETWTLLKDQIYDTSYFFSLNDCLPPKEQWPSIQSYHLKVKASSNRGQKTSEDIIEIPVIPYIQSSSAFSSSEPIGYFSPPLNIILLVQLIGGASILVFIVTLVVVIRRQQLK